MKDKTTRTLTRLLMWTIMASCAIMLVVAWTPIVMFRPEWEPTGRFILSIMFIGYAFSVFWIGKVLGMFSR